MYKGIFDTHAHYDDESFEYDRDALLSSLPEKGISCVINCAVELDSCEKSRRLAEQYSYMYFSAGVHPENCASAADNYIETIKTFISHKKCAAIGEIGLDYHYDFTPRELQKKIFEQQLILAKEADMPVIIHDREAHGDTLELLKRYRPKGVLHCFSGSAESAAEMVKLGMYLGFGGAVTFKNAKKPIEAVKAVPLEKLLLETDCPYMTPVPHRGKRNDSSFIAFTAEKIAQLRGIDAQELIAAASANARNIFSKCE